MRDYAPNGLGGPVVHKGYQPVMPGEIGTGIVLPGPREMIPGRREAEKAAYADSEYLAARDACDAAWEQWKSAGFPAEAYKTTVRPLRDAKDDAYDRAVRRELERTGAILKKEFLGYGDVWQPPLDDSAVEDDPDVVRLRAALEALPPFAYKAEEPSDPNARRSWKTPADRIRYQIEVARGRAYERISRDAAKREREEGTVLTPEARAWLSHLVELNGVEAVCAKFQVSAGIVQRLIKGVSTPPSWRHLPEEET